MQPTVPQSAGAADMDLPAVQSMDWLFKKERIYLLAQFWQQVIIPKTKNIPKTVSTSNTKEEINSSIVAKLSNQCVHVQTTGKAKRRRNQVWSVKQCVNELCG